MCMYQGLGQMLTMCLQHHQGCSENPKCAYVIYGQPHTECHNVLPRTVPVPAWEDDHDPASCPAAAAAQSAQDKPQHLQPMCQMKYMLICVIIVVFVKKQTLLYFPLLCSSQPPSTYLQYSGPIYPCDFVQPAAAKEVNLAASFLT